MGTDNRGESGVRERIARLMAPRIGRRIFLALSLVAIPTLLMAAISIYYLRSVGQGLIQLAERDRLLETNALRLEIAAEQRSDGLLGFLLSGEEEYMASFSAAQGMYEQAMGQLEALIESPEEQASLAEIKRLNAAFLAAAEGGIALQRQGWPTTAIFRRQGGREQLQKSLIAELERFVALQSRAIAANAARARTQMAQAVVWSAALVGLALVVGTWAGVAITRSLTGPIQALLAATEAIKGGDLEARVPMAGTDELAELAVTMNQMAQSLSRSRQQLKNLLSETERRNRELAALNAIAATVSQSLDLAEILDDAVDKTLQVMEIEAGGIYLLDEEARVLTVTAQRGFSPQFVAGINGLRVGEGFSGRVAQSGQPLVVRDVSSDARLTRMVVREEGLRSLAIVPLSSRGRVLGTLFAVTHGYREFTPQDVQLLTSIGHQIGVAVENARLFEAEQRRAEQFRVISEVGRHMTSILAVDELLAQIARLIQEAFNYYHVGIGLIEGDELVYKVGAGLVWDDPHFQFEPARLKVGQEGIGGWVAGVGEPLLVPDVSQEPRYVWMRGSKTRSELTVPIKAKGEVIGVVDVQSDQLDAFDESDLLVLQSLAHQAAIAIENARLFAQVEQRMRELEALYRAEEELNRAEEELYCHLRLDQVLQALVNVAVDLFQADKSSLMVWDEQRERLVVEAARGFSRETLAQMSFAPGEGIVGRVAISGEPIVVRDTCTDPRVTKYFTESEGICSFMHVPIKIGGQVFGVFNVNYAQPRAFGDDDLRLCLALAQRAALAIENARLYEQAQQLAVVEERNRLARELHDSVTQSLFSMTLTAQAARTLLERDPQRAGPQLGRLQELAQGALAEMRSLIFQLRPAAVEEEGLVPALRKHMAALKSRGGLDVEFRVEGERRLPREQERGLFRIVQEALNNVVKHAQTGRALVELKMGNERISLLVEDHGIGFDPFLRQAVGEPVEPQGAAGAQAGERTMGLITMRERAELMGGTFEVESRPGEGTRVRINLGARGNS